MNEMPIDFGGPWLAASIFCERALLEKDGVTSLLRIVDTVIASAPANTPTDVLNRMPWNGWIFLSIKWDDYRGQLEVSLTRTPPGVDTEGEMSRIWSGNTRDHPTKKGIQIRVESSIVFGQEGLHWFSFYLNGQLQSRLPHSFVFQPTSGEEGQSQVVRAGEARSASSIDK